jgi:hypothetical protein
MNKQIIERFLREHILLQLNKIEDSPQNISHIEDWISSLDEYIIVVMVSKGIWHHSSK